MEIENNKIQKINLISVITFSGVFFGIVRSYFGSYVFNNKFPLNTFLFDPADRFNDLINMIKICLNNSPYITNFKFASNYFPVANTIFFLFSLISNNYILIIAFAGIFLVWYTKTAFRLIKVNEHNLLNLLVIFLFSYPVFFNIDRLNIEIYNFLFCLLWLYYKDRNKPWAAIFFLSLSISLKLYTGVFVILYLKDKNYKQIVSICLMVLTLSILSLITFKGDTIANFNAMLTSLKNFSGAYSGLNGLQYNLSLFGLIKVIFYIVFKAFHISQSVFNINTILPYYTLTAFLIFLCVIYVICTKKLPRWMNLFLLCGVLIIFPNVSFDYKLIFIYLPLIYFLKEKSKTKYDILYSIGFASLLIPHNYIYLTGNISTAVVIYPVIIMVMSLFIIFKSSLNAAN